MRMEDLAVVRRDVVRGDQVWEAGVVEGGMKVG